MISSADLDGRQRMVAAERADILSQYQSLIKGGFSAKDAQGRVGVSRQTLARWTKDFEKFGIAGLADRTANRRGGKKILPQDHKMFLYKSTLNQHKPKIMTIYREEYQEFCMSLGDQPVSYATFRREYESIPESTKILYREGEAAFKNTNPHHSRDWGLIKPMDAAVSDHVMLNIQVLKNGKPVRPWVTWWMDGNSRKALGWVVSTNPNQDTISLSLLRVVNKYGTPEKAYMDNGKDYTAISLHGANTEGKRASKKEQMLDEIMIRGIFTSLHIEPVFAIPYNAKAKHIEPAHNFIHNRCRTIEYGYIGADIKDRPEYMSSQIKTQGQAKKLDLSRLMDWNEVDGFVNEVFESYNKHEHTGLNHQLQKTKMTSNIVFDMGFNYELLETFHKMVDKRDLAMLMMRVAGKTYKVRGNGVTYRKNLYFHDLLLVKKMEGQRVIIRFDPADVNERNELNIIYIYDSKDLFLCGAPILGKNHPFEATSEEFATVGRRKKIRREGAREDYRNATRLVADVPLSEMSFDNQSQGVN